MTAAQADAAVGVMILVQLTALTTAVFARFHQGRPLQNFCHGVFMFCLAMSGLTTLVALFMGPGYGTASGAALAVSVLTAVWEIRKTGPAHAR